MSNKGLLSTLVRYLIKFKLMRKDNWAVFGVYPACSLRGLAHIPECRVPLGSLCRIFKRPRVVGGFAHGS